MNDVERMNDVEPLAPVTWFGALKRLARRSGFPPENDLESRLRHAYHLLQLTPRELRHTVRTNLNEKEFEKLLQCGAFQSAATELIGDRLSYAVSKLGGDLFEALVSFPGQLDPIAVRSKDAGSALLAAWVRCLIVLETRPLPARTEIPAAAERVLRSDSHLTLVET